MPKVSVIIPVYNVAPFISQCLESVASQTFTDFEAILVDDCGTDESVEIAQSFIDDYIGPVSFKFVHHETNRGLSAARNTGIDISAGEYLYFLDSDDYIVPDCLEKMVSCLQKYPDSEIVFAGAFVQNVNDYFWLDYTNKDIPEHICDRYLSKSLILRRFTLSMTAWNRLISKSFIIVNNLYFEEGYIHEDELWNFAIAKYAQSLSIIKENLYHYRIRPEGIMGAESINQKAYSMVKICHRMVENIDPYLQKKQVLSIWQIIRGLFEDEALSELYRDDFRHILRKMTKLVDFGTAMFIFIYSKSVRFYYWLYTVPKIRGYMNIKLRF